MGYCIDEYITIWMNDGYTRDEIITEVNRVFDEEESNEMS